MPWLCTVLNNYILTILKVAHLLSLESQCLETGFIKAEQKVT